MPLRPVSESMTEEMPCASAAIFIFMAASEAFITARVYSVSG